MEKPPVYIIGLAGEVGALETTAEQLGKRFNLSGEEVTKKTGVTKLHRFGTPNGLVMASCSVARRVITNTFTPLDQISGIFGSSNCTTETLMPGYATQVAAKFGLTHVLADQVGMGCGGSLQALRAAHDRLIVDALDGKTSWYLVVAGDATSLILDEKDYDTGFLFSEGAAALLVTNDKRINHGAYQIMSIGTKSFLGNYLDLLTIGNPYWVHTRGELAGFKMAGGGVFRFGASLIPHFLQLVGTEKFGDDWMLFPHQANLRMLQAMAANAGVPEDRVYMDGIRRIGNTSPPAVFLGLEDGLERRIFDKSNTVLLGAFGGELTVGAALLKPLGDPTPILC